MIFSQMPNLNTRIQFYTVVVWRICNTCWRDSSSKQRLRKGIVFFLWCCNIMGNKNEAQAFEVQTFLHVHDVGAFAGYDFSVLGLFDCSKR